MALGFKKGDLKAEEVVEKEIIDTPENEPKYEVILRLYLKGKLCKEGEVVCDTQQEVTAALDSLKAKLNTNDKYITWGPFFFERVKFKRIKIVYKKSK